jgi:hypothetical protein
MKRIIAAVLVAAMAVQSAGCTTTYPVLPVAAGPAPVRVATLDAADRNPNQVVAAPVSVRPPDLASGDFLGGPAAGILAGVALIGVIGLLILAKGTSGSKSDGGGGGRGGPGGPTLGGGF